VGDDALKFDIVFSAFVVDETFFICLSICWAVSKLRASDWRQLAKFDVFPWNLL